MLSGCSGVVRFSSSAPATDRAPVTDREPASEINLSPQVFDGSAELRAAVVAEALKWMGTPYCYGGSSYKCTDCSGFIMEVYRSAGLELPRTAAKQYAYSKRIAAGAKLAGDLVFFSKNGKISHVGLYIGANEMIHASSSKGVVRQSLSDSGLKGRYVGAGRVYSLNQRF